MNTVQVFRYDASMNGAIIKAKNRVLVHTGLSSLIAAPVIFFSVVTKRLASDAQYTVVLKLFEGGLSFKFYIELFFNVTTFQNFQILGCA